MVRLSVHQRALDVLAELVAGGTLMWKWQDAPLRQREPRYVMWPADGRPPTGVPLPVIHQLKSRGLIEPGEHRGEVRLAWIARSDTAGARA